MMENDDKLLVAFFDENRQEIPDNGFTRRVMRHLPDRTIIGNVLFHTGVSAVLCFRRSATGTGHAP